MTTALYFDPAQVQCTATVLQHKATADGWLLELDQTLFLPKGGGQLADGGWIDQIEVSQVFCEHDVIWHQVSRLPVSDHVTLQLDKDRRQLHSRLHSAGHLLGALGEQFGLQATKAQHWPDNAYVSFTLPSEIPPIDLSEWQQLLNQRILDDLNCKIEMKESGRHVAFGNHLGYRCGGTHVQSTREIGPVDLYKVKVKSGVLTVCYRLQGDIECC